MLLREELRIIIAKWLTQQKTIMLINLMDFLLQG